MNELFTAISTLPASASETVNLIIIFVKFKKLSNIDEIMA
jgi:hypothetical protein